MRAHLALLSLAAALIAGCATYTERRACSNGTVFDDNGACVLPPGADGGASFETCAELCAMIPDWTSAQIACLQGNLMLAGPLPAECTTLDTTEACDACVVAAGADDAACALSRACL